MIRLPRLQSTNPIVDKDGRPSTSFQLYFQRFAETIEGLITQIADILGITDQLTTDVGAVAVAAQAATDAAAAADAAAASAQAAADAAAAAGVASASDQALVASGITPASVLSASPTLISVAAHDRVYGDGTSVSVSAGAVAATAPADVDYVSYVDPTRSGGAVTYIASTTPPVQGSDVHVVGAVLIPAAGSSAGGDGPRYPGAVEP